MPNSPFSLHFKKNRTINFEQNVIKFKSVKLSIKISGKKQRGYLTFETASFFYLIVSRPEIALHKKLTL